MSDLHLKKGSLQPPKFKDKLRLYSMRYCPFAQRVRLVLLVKNIPHDIVNIHIYDKPEWIFDLNPTGQVPILDTGAKIISESIDVCNYLDTEYPDPPLYTKDETKIADDRNLMEHLNNIFPIFYEVLKGPNTKSYDQYMEILLPLVEKYENELNKRGTLYFGGNAPHMLDYMLWPFAERATLCGKTFGEKIPGVEVFPKLYAWCLSMRLLPEVEQLKTNIDYQEEIFEHIRSNDYSINFDVV